MSAKNKVFILNRFFVFFILLFYILQPWLLNGVVRFEFISIAFSFITLLIFKERTSIPRFEFALLFSFLFFSVIITIVHSEFDFSYVSKTVKLMIMIIGGFYIVEYTKLTFKDLSNVIKYTVIICLIFYAFCVLNETGRNIALALKGETYGIEHSLEVYRLWFPTSGHTFHLGIFFITTTVILLIARKQFIWILASFLCASIASRSAMLACIGLIILFVCMKNKKIILILLLLIPASILSIPYLAERSTQARYALEPIIHLMETGKLESKSSDKLLDKHLYIPDLTYITLGSGRYVDNEGHFFGGTDSGVMRPMLYGGIIFQIFYFVLLLTMLRFFFTEGVFGYAVICSFLILNVKAEVLTSSPFMSLFTLLYFIAKRESKMTGRDLI